MTLTDPRLEAIDLRGKLKVYRFKVTDAAGRWVPDSRARLSGTDGSWREVGGNASRKTVVTTPGPATLCVSAPGYRYEYVKTADVDQSVVVLKPGLAVRLRLAPDVDVPDDYQVSGMALSEGGPGADLSTRFDEAGEVTLVFPEPGTYRVLFRLRSKTHDDVYVFTPYVRHIEHPEVRFTVRDQPGEQAFEVTLPNEALKETAARMAINGADS